MLHLYDGKGQLGEALQLYYEVKRDVAIYHTWNFLDKTEKTQKECFRKFVKFVDSYPGEVYFISTKCNLKNPYVKYKRLAENYLLRNNPEGHIIRLPNLIGKGICEKFKNNEVKPYGTIELMDIEKAAHTIIDLIRFKCKSLNISLNGEKISAKLAHKLIQFGK